MRLKTERVEKAAQGLETGYPEMNTSITANQWMDTKLKQSVLGPCSDERKGRDAWGVLARKETTEKSVNEWYAMSWLQALYYKPTNPSLAQLRLRGQQPQR